MTISPLNSARNRLDEAHRAWHGALDGYHRIEDFRANINSAIQALRNVTFALQKQKDGLFGFDSWYVGWQTKMMNDPILKAFHSARTVIVHQEDLKLKSTATARTKGWIDLEKASFDFDPTKDSYEVASVLYDTYAKHLPVAEEVKERLLFEFERKWVHDKLPNHELLEAIAHAYNFLCELLQDAEKNFTLEPKEDSIKCSYCSCATNAEGKLKCMILTQQERCLTFALKDGRALKLHTGLIHRNEEDLVEVRKKYGDEWRSEETLALLADLFPLEYPFNQMKLFAQVAIANLKKDKTLLPMSFIFKESDKDVPIMIALSFNNQEQKVMAMDTVAKAIEKNNGKSVLTLAEVWIYPTNNGKFSIPSHDNTRGAKDALQFSCVTAENIKIITLPFSKNIFGKIIFSQPTVEEFSSDNHSYFMMLPLINALKRVNYK